MYEETNFSLLGFLDTPWLNSEMSLSPITTCTEVKDIQSRLRLGNDKFKSFYHTHKHIQTSTSKSRGLLQKNLHGNVFNTRLQSFGAAFIYPKESTNTHFIHQSSDGDSLRPTVKSPDPSDTLAPHLKSSLLPGTVGLQQTLLIIAS